MEIDVLSLIYSKRVFIFIEYNLVNFNTVWENKYEIIFEIYNKNYYNRLKETLLSIKIDKPFEIGEVENRLKIGHLLFIAKKEESIIGFFWIALNFIESPYFHATIKLNKDEAVDYNSYVVEEWRGKRINAGLKTLAFNYLKQNGIKKIFGYINESNRISINANLRFGYQIIGKIVQRILMTLEFRSHNVPSNKIVFNGGLFRLWKGLFRKTWESLNNAF